MSWLSDLFGMDRSDQAKQAQAQSQSVANAQQQAAADAQAAQKASMTGAQTDLTNRMQSQYQGFDPNAFAAQQTSAASNAAASAARGAGANAGKAARFGNVGIQNASANAISQGYGIQGNLANQAYNARAGLSGGYGNMAVQAGQMGMGYQDIANRGTQQAENNAVSAGDRIAGGIEKFGGGIMNLAQGKSFFAPQKEKGGEVTAGEPVIVGEKRPEVFVPKSDGVIVPEVSKHSIKLMKDFLEVVNKYRKKAG